MDQKLLTFLADKLPKCSKPQKSGVLLGIAVLFLSVSIFGWLIARNYQYNSMLEDEVVHIISGLELLQAGSYNIEALHPPLARLASAVGPYLAGVRFSDEFLKNIADINLSGYRFIYTTYFFSEASKMLQSNNSISSTELINLARLGQIVFFCLLAGAVYVWVLKYSSPSYAFLAALIAISNVNIIAVSSFAITDLAQAASFTAAAYMLTVWLRNINLANSMLAGVAIGIALSAKMSNLFFLLIATAAIILYYDFINTNRLRGFNLRVATYSMVLFIACFLALWGVYGYKIEGYQSQSPILGTYLDGIVIALLRNYSNWSGYILGKKLFTSGVWYYFPVVLFFKTPIIYMLVLGWSGILYLSKGGFKNYEITAPLLFGGAVMALSMASNLNIGIRHVIVIYPLLTIFLTLSLFNYYKKFAPYVLSILLLGQLVISYQNQANALSYFNYFAGSEPYKIAMDSNYDWGQKIAEAVEILKKRGIANKTVVIQEGWRVSADFYGPTHCFDTSNSGYLDSYYVSSIPQYAYVLIPKSTYQLLSDDVRQLLEKYTNLAFEQELYFLFKK